jgi:hypothetical protein
MISKAGVGMYATMIVALLHLIGVDVDEGMITEAVLAFATLISFGIWVYGQFDRKDLKFGLFRDGAE